MKITITNRFTGATIYECEAGSLRGAILECVKFGRNLSGADLSGADLSGAILYGTDLSRANLSGAKEADYAIAQTRILAEGTIYGYKKVSTPNGTGVVKLLIPEYAKRSSAFGRKCRCEYAEVIEAPDGAYTEEHGPRTEEHGPRTEYRVGEVVKPDKWDDNWQEECSHGIHFFITRLEAENY